MSLYAASPSIPYQMAFTASGIMGSLPMDAVVPSWRSYPSDLPTQFAIVVPENDVKSMIRLLLREGK